MNFSKFINKKTIAIAAYCLVGLVLIWLAYDNLSFRVKSVDPSSDNTPTSIAYIKVSFSQPIKSIDTVTLNDEDTQLSIEGRDVKVVIKDGLLDEGVNYSLRLSGIHSAWFNNTLTNTSFVFIPHYIEYGRLSVEQRTALVDRSSSGQIDDSFLNNSFPIITDDYQIEAKNIGNGKDIYVYITFLKEIPDYDQGGAVRQLSNTDADTLRESALKTIKQKGGDPDKYKVIYSNKYLNDKYSN